MNQVRIIGGKWRRQLLRFPDGQGLRPTPDRVRETLFNWLGQDLSGQTCLDLFAGSGALGFEAASRGAERVVMVEASPKAVQGLREQVRKLAASAQIEVVAGDALKFLAQCRTRFDVIFVDPPYNLGWLQKLEACLVPFLAENGVVYLEAETPVASFGPWQTVRQGKAGQACFHLLRQEACD